jgi:hypothetical protein
MKIRSLHPEFFTDPTVAELSYPARILFAGLWCRSDDYGRGRWLPKAIEGDVFPRDDVDILALLGELVDLDLIRVYRARGDEFYSIPSWEKYQSPKYRAKTSIPEPPDPKTPGHTDPGQIGDNPGRVPPELSQGEGEGEVEGEVEGVLAPKPARDEVWDTLAAVFGEPTTQTNRSLRGKLVKSLAAAGATDSEIVARVQRWPLHFPEATLTETALEKHWDRLATIPARATKQQARQLDTALSRREQRRKILGGEA